MMHFQKKRTQQNKTTQQLKAPSSYYKAPELSLRAIGVWRRNVSHIMVLEELRGLTFLSMDSPKPQGEKILMSCCQDDDGSWQNDKV